MFSKQFLLSTKNVAPLDNFIKTAIGDYFLYHHKNVVYTSAKHQNKECYLLGALYSWKTPQLHNSDILDALISHKHLNDFLVEISKFYGEYVIIYKEDNDIIIFNDACAQREVYYDTSFETFGSQPKLIQTIQATEDHTSEAAHAYYTSEYFKKNTIFVSDSTHLSNVKHLLANHYINITRKEVKRFFPILKKEEQDIDTIAKKAAAILQGYIKAIALRHDIIMPVTGGYDSRILFLASKNITSSCTYFISKHVHMDWNHYDITIPKRLTALYGKEFIVNELKDNPKSSYNKDYFDSIDFPRYLTLSPLANENNVLLNANISEVSSCKLYSHKHIDAIGLAVLKKQIPSSFVVAKYDDWLQKTRLDIKGLNYDILDLFYWEEFESNWVAKLKTEGHALGKHIISPFNSRYLLNLLLSAKRSKRGVFNNVLYDRIIYYLSKNHKAVVNLPINPNTMTKLFRLMSKLNVLNFYQRYRLRKKVKAYKKHL